MDPFKEFELPIADIPYLKNLSRYCLNVFHDDPVMARAFLFRLGLVGFYDCMWDSMKVEVGHILYRLSDFVDESERKQIWIYPSKIGTIVDEYDRCDSLEDWRKQWAKMHHIIPEFDLTKKLKTHELLVLPVISKQ